MRALCGDCHAFGLLRPVGVYLLAYLAGVLCLTCALFCPVGCSSAVSSRIYAGPCPAYLCIPTRASYLGVSARLCCLASRPLLEGLLPCNVGGSPHSLSSPSRQTTLVAPHLGRTFLGPKLPFSPISRRCHSVSAIPSLTHVFLRRSFSLLSIVVLGHPCCYTVPSTCFILHDPHALTVLYRLSRRTYLASIVTTLLLLPARLS